MHELGRPPDALFAGPGELRARCRALDWAATPLGPVEGWPTSLRTAVGTCLGSRFPMAVLWGPELVMVYNDAQRAVLGAAHPAALGRPAREVWAEFWHETGPRLAAVLAGGPADWYEDGPIGSVRGGEPGGAPEVAAVISSFSPVPDEAGGVGGVLATVVETTWRDRAHPEAGLRASEERYRVLVDTLPGAAVFVVGHDLRYQLAAGEAFRAAGFTAEQFVGRPVEAVLGGDAVGEYARNLRGALAGEPFELEHFVHQRAFLTRGVPLLDGAGGVSAALAVSVDITALRGAEAALRASEARNRALVDNVRDYGIFLLDAAGVIVEWTPGAERVKGWTADEVVGRHVAMCHPREEVASGELDRQLVEAAATGRAERESWRVRRDGSRFWADEIVTAVRDASGALLGFTAITRDLTERRLAEAAAEQAQLAAARDELRRALAAAEEGERQRLARELHDQLGQELTAFRLGLEEAERLAAGRVPPDEPERAPLLARLAQLGALAQRMTVGARTLALELRPPELDDVGLESAVETYVAGWSERYNTAAEVAVTGPAAATPIPADAGSVLYRIVQESLTNVAKHAGASQVSVILEKLHGAEPSAGGPLSEVRLVIEDDGRGFDPDETAIRVRAEQRLGFAGMRERAALVGGTLAVESSPGAGTTVYVRLPVEPPVLGPGAGGSGA